MTLLQLHYFCTLAHICHYTRAAQELHISQPALSYAINELETELGGKLFEKKHRKIELTECGRAFLPYVENSIFQLETGISAVSEIVGNKKLTVSIGHLHSIAGSFIPQIIKHFYQKEENRKIKFLLTEGISDGLLSDLLVGKLDFAFSTNRNDWAESIMVLSQPLYLAVPPTHPLAERSSVSLEEFAGEALIAIKKPSNLRIQTDQIFMRHNIVPNIAFEVRDCTTALQYVGMSLGSTILPEIPMIDQNKASILLIQDSNGEFTRPVYCSWAKNKPLSPAVAQVRDFILEHYLYNPADG